MRRYTKNEALIYIVTTIELNNLEKNYDVLEEIIIEKQNLYTQDELDLLLNKL